MGSNVLAAQDWQGLDLLWTFRICLALSVSDLAFPFPGSVKSVA